MRGKELTVHLTLSEFTDLTQNVKMQDTNVTYMAKIISLLVNNATFKTVLLKIVWAVTVDRMANL